MVKAVWDTGAPVTAISRSTAAKLNLKPIGKINVKAYYDTDGTTEDLYEIEARFTPGHTANIQVMSLNDKLGADMIIGMDIISTGKMELDQFEDGKVYWSFDFK